MQALKRKARSQKGASITFALLLFLVCAVVSSVVIVAATTAAGRMSNQNEMDERYYAVAAAAKQLYEVFDGQDVTLSYEIKNGIPDIANATVQYSDSTNNETPPEILQEASKDVFQRVLLNESVPAPDPITVSNDNKLVCTINRDIQSDGRLVYTISAQKTENASSSGYYTVFLSFSPNLSQSVTDISATEGQAVIKWKLLGAKKNRATSS